MSSLPRGEAPSVVGTDALRMAVQNGVAHSMAQDEQWLELSGPARAVLMLNVTRHVVAALSTLQADGGHGSLREREAPIAPQGEAMSTSPTTAMWPTLPSPPPCPSCGKVPDLYIRDGAGVRAVCLSPGCPTGGVVVPTEQAETPVVGWQPTHRHIKSGGFYQVIERAKDITNEHGEAGVEVVIYRGVGGHTWVRRASEFDDGRFEPLPPAPTEGAAR